MLTITHDQLRKLARARREPFEIEMAKHLRGFARRHCEVLGEARLRAAIAANLDVAARYGLAAVGPLQLFLELTFMFGSGFATDPSLPWAKEALAHRGAGDSDLFQAARLHASVLAYLQAADGPDHAFTYAALRRVRTLVGESAPEDLRTALPERLHGVHPEKCDYAGEAGIAAFVDEVIRRAEALGLETPRGIAVVALLMFTLGHEVFEDPLYPWVGRGLATDIGSSTEERLARLERRSIRFLDLVLGEAALA
jgi:hypothetical protein